MFKKIAIISSWFVITPVAFVFLVVLLAQTRKIDYLSGVGPQIVTSKYADNGQDGNVLGVQISDMRPYYVEHFLKGTKLEPYSNYIVETSDKYGIDYRLIPAIAMKESGGGSAIPESTHNAWGFENGRTHFTSWEQAIETVAKTLKEKYIARGLTSPDDMMPVYAPPAVENGGAWAKTINSYLAQMEDIQNSL